MKTSSNVTLYFVNNALKFILLIDVHISICIYSLLFVIICSFYVFSLKNDDFLYIAEEIVKLFPTEATATYYIPPIPKKLSRIGKSVISREKLVDKYRNKIRALKLINEWKPLSNDLQEHKTESSDSDEEAILEAKAWLQNHSMPWEIVLTNWKLTAEYRRKMLYYNFLQLIADITKVQEQKRKKAADLGITLQPFIIAVGPSNDISDIFISVDDTLYKVPSALKAIDLCYKIFQVFDVEYPIESAHIWLLFQRVLYNYENSLDKMTPNITEIISDMTFQHKDT
ncbi:uncharacterized protein LOC118645740 [Monomorium pharaonis]|uniref:uncharacterized protein LOC118645740 n=1 Tax=Monomorium pharaonis TaxID=307658 RepID=UPI0017467C6B|nr:uncharacterized protein LOC118645740 [Monomorium pharaonis]